MKKFLILSAIAIAIIILLALAVTTIRNNQTKSFSPEEVVSFVDGDLRIAVHYNRPYKKGREIFGDLVPYGKIWRTGANEATIFETNKPVFIKGKNLAPGKYTVWTVPDSTAWLVIFNSETGQWGVNSKGEPNRDPSLDALSITAPTILQDKEFEQFTIRFDKIDTEAEMVILWDKTVVVIPFIYR